MNRTYCHIRCTWMPSLLCESSHKTLPVGNSLVFLQVTRLWEALVTLSLLFLSCVVSHVSSIHLIHRNSCLTSCTHSFQLQEYFNNSFSHLMKRSYRHIWDTWMPSLLCESSHESCGFSHVSPSHMTLRTSWHTLSTKTVSLLCGFPIFLPFTWSCEAHVWLCVP